MERPPPLLFCLIKLVFIFNTKNHEINYFKNKYDLPAIRFNWVWV